MSKRKRFRHPMLSIDAILFRFDGSDSNLESEDDGWPKIIDGNCSYINDLDRMNKFSIMYQKKKEMIF